MKIKKALTSIAEIGLALAAVFYGIEQAGYILQALTGILLVVLPICSAGLLYMCLKADDGDEESERLLRKFYNITTPRYNAVISVIMTVLLAWGGYVWTAIGWGLLGVIGYFTSKLVITQVEELNEKATTIA